MKKKLSELGEEFCVEAEGEEDKEDNTGVSDLHPDMWARHVLRNTEKECFRKESLARNLSRLRYLGSWIYVVVR